MIPSCQKWDLNSRPVNWTETWTLDHSDILTHCWHNTNLLAYSSVNGSIKLNEYDTEAPISSLIFKWRSWLGKSTCIVVVITAVLHTAGPQFEPGQVHCFSFVEGVDDLFGKQYD